MESCPSFVQPLTKHLPLIRRQPILPKVADSLGRYLLKLVGPRFADEYRNLVVCGRTPTHASEFLNGRIALGVVAEFDASPIREW